jgi:hypothetical protein
MRKFLIMKNRQNSEKEFFCHFMCEYIGFDVITGLKIVELPYNLPFWVFKLD